MLSADVMRRVRRLQWRARRTVRTLQGGEYRSAFRGAGLSFEEVREYQPGDDVRLIDWNVTARMGTAYLKRYAEERELTIHLLVDLSESMRFGTGGVTKRTAAAELAAVLAFAAVLHDDRVGFAGFTDRVERRLPPGKGTRHALGVLREVLYAEGSGRTTDLGAALDDLNRAHRRRAIVFVFSDFQTTGYEAAFRRAARRHDLIAVRVTDPLERAWPAVGRVRVEDAETGERLVIDTDDAGFRRAFADRAAARAAELTTLCRRTRTDLIDVTTDGKHFDALLRFFRRRDRLTSHLGGA